MAAIRMPCVPGFRVARVAVSQTRVVELRISWDRSLAILGRRPLPRSRAC
jgi:hypothetical protein